MTMTLYVPDGIGGFKLDPLPFGVVIERRRDGNLYVRPRVVDDLVRELLHRQATMDRRSLLEASDTEGCSHD